MEVLSSEQKWMLPREFLAFGDTMCLLLDLGFEIIEEDSDEGHYCVKAPTKWELIISDVETRMTIGRRKLSFIVNSNGKVVAIVYVTSDRHEQDMLQVVHVVDYHSFPEARNSFKLTPERV